MDEETLIKLAKDLEKASEEACKVNIAVLEKEDLLRLVDEENAIKAILDYILGREEYEDSIF